MATTSKSASVRDLAKLSLMAYFPNQKKYEDWKQIEYFGNRSGMGFGAALFVNEPHHEAVLAFRGTDFDQKDLSDLLSNYFFSILMRPPQFEPAMNAYKQSISRCKLEFGEEKPHTLYLAGHSLGGALASLVSANSGGLPTVTFNSPGMKSTQTYNHFSPFWLTKKNEYDLLSVKKNKMLHVRNTGDLISLLTGDHIGTEKEVYTDNWGNGSFVTRILEQHDIKLMFEGMEHIPWTMDELNW